MVMRHKYTNNNYIYQILIEILTITHDIALNFSFKSFASTSILKLSIFYFLVICVSVKPI